jgi:hypothetical protein
MARRFAAPEPLHYPIILKTREKIIVFMDLATLGCASGVKRLDVETAHGIVTTIDVR